MVRQIPSGIAGLDVLLRGGLPRHRTLLISGPAGAGKSTFGLQFIYQGIIEEGETGIYITYDDKLSNVRGDCLNYGWDLKVLEDQGLLILADGFSSRAGVYTREEYTTTTDVDDMLAKLIKWIDELGAERVVVDSITALALSLPNEAAIRREILKLSAVMGSLDATTLLISEMGPNGEVSRFGVEEFMAAGAIALNYKVINHASIRSLQIRKMRGVAHRMTTHPFVITNTGIDVLQNERYYE